jgi:predicted O-methyltransferase YrrM
MKMTVTDANGPILGLGVDLLRNPVGLGMDIMANRIATLVGIIDFDSIQTIIDVGSATGYNSLNLARVFTKAKTYGFEPKPENYQACLQMRAGTNRIISQRMNFSNLALSPQKDIIVDEIDLDTWCSQNSTQPDLIWIDSPGDEIAVLNGAGTVLDNTQVVMIQSLQSLGTEVSAYLTPKGFAALTPSDGSTKNVIYIRKNPAHQVITVDTTQVTMTQPTLADIIDSKSLDTNKESMYSFCSHFYEAELAKYRDKPVSMLEIGVWNGGSLQLWSEYFTNARVLGIDVYLMPQVGPMVAKYNSVSIIIADAYSEEKANTLGDFDIIVDDGSHELVNQLFMVEHYLPKVKPGGLFVIEVVQSAAWFEQLMAAVPDQLKPHARCVDLSKVKGKEDALLFAVRVPEGMIIEKPSATAKKPLGPDQVKKSSTKAPEPTVHPQGPRQDLSRLRYALVTIHDNNYKDLADITWEQNKREYAELHKYDLIAKTSGFGDMPIGFEKIALLRKIMDEGKHDVLYWSGTDVMITNYCIPLTEFVYPQHHVVISNDFNGINADSFVIRNTMEGRAWLDMIMSRMEEYRNHPYVEQGVMMDTQASMSHVVKVLPQRYLNAYYLPLYHQKGAKDDLDSLGYGGNWRVGDFCLHAPDLPMDIRLALFNQVMPRVIKS